MAFSTLQTLTTPSLHHTLQLSATRPHRHCTTIKAYSNSKCSLSSTPNLTPNPNNTRRLAGVGIGLLAASILLSSPLDANATRIEYYATVAEPSCELQFAPSGLGYCDVAVGFGEEAPYSTLINIHYTARFGDGIVFDSSYKRGRPLTMRIGVGKVIKGLDQGIFGGEGVPPMLVGMIWKIIKYPFVSHWTETETDVNRTKTIIIVPRHKGGRRRLQIPPELAYGPEPAGCFSGDCNIPANATLLYDVNFVNIYSGNRKN